MDNTQDIANKFKHDKTGLEQCYKDWKESINCNHRDDSNSAAASNTEVKELEVWLKNKNKLISELADQNIVSDDMPMDFDE